MARTLLLADDSPTIRKIVELTFHDTDIRVELVGTGAEAVARLEAVHPDLVLLDVVMPEPTGYEICRTIKESDRPVPVVLLAGTFEPFDLQLARDCGADDHLVKPFESTTLVEKVERLLSCPTGSALEVEQVLDELVEEQQAPVAPPVAAGPADVAPPAASGKPPSHSLSPDDIDALACVIVERLSDRVVREIAERVVPELARSVIREQLGKTGDEDS